MDMTATGAAATLASSQEPSGGPLPSGQGNRATSAPLSLSPTLSWTSLPVNKTDISLLSAARDPPYAMADATTPSSSSGPTAAAGSCTLLPGNPTTVSAACLPSKSGASTGSNHQPVASALFPDPPPTSLSVLPPVTHNPADHSAARSGLLVTSDTHAITESSSSTLRKLPHSSFIPPKSVTTLKSTLICPSVAATRSPTPNYSHISMSHGTPPSTWHGLPDQVSCAPTKLSPITTTPLTQVPVSPGTLGTSQSTHPTITSTVTETPESTFSTPVSITEMASGQPTVSAPPFITSTGQTTLADGTVISVTQVIANPAQDASHSSAGHAFFGNHAVVISVFLISGMAVAFILVLAFCYFRRQRRRRRQNQRHEGKVVQDIDISAPLPPKPFAIGEHASPHGRWDMFLRPGDQPAATRSTSNLPLHRGENSGVPATHAIVDIPPPPPPPPQRQQQSQRTQNRLSYRVPVSYAGLGALGSNPRATEKQYMGPFSDYHPVQAVQKHTTPSVPPPPPKRSPLRLLATKNDPKIPQENAERLSGASSLSLYPPSLYPSDAEVDSLYQKEVGAFQSRDTSDSSTRGVSSSNNLGMGQREKAGNNNQSTGLNGVDSDDAPSAWNRGLRS